MALSLTSSALSYSLASSPPSLARLQTQKLQISNPKFSPIRKSSLNPNFYPSPNVYSYADSPFLENPNFGVREYSKDSRTFGNYSFNVSLAARASGPVTEMIKKKNSESPVVVYSKTWCPYCGQVKGLFRKLGVEAKIIELDQLVEENDVQSALYDLTGQSTVPNVFIGGNHIGGCDTTVGLHSAGKLIPLLTEAGALK